MDNISIGTLASVAGVIAFLYTYVKDRYDSGKAIGKLEQRVNQLETNGQILEQLTQTLTDTRLAVARLEQKVEVISTWVTQQQGNNNNG
jgi:predicted transposase YdaD